MTHKMHIQTPVLRNNRLSAALNKNIVNKMECYQPSGSFKNRGLCHLAQASVSAGKTQLMSSSGGNAGLAVAYAGRILKVPVTVIVPKNTHPKAIERIKLMGAEVSVEGEVWDDADAVARALAEAQNAAYIPPFDNPLIWEGHASLVDELVAQMDKPDAIILSVGGGGLLCGVVQGLQRHDWYDVPIMAVETEGAASLHAAMQAGKLVKLDKIDTIATTLGAKQVAERTLACTREHDIQSVVVSDARTVNACLQFADDMRALVEPACGAALSVVYDNLECIAPYQNILVIVCGGAGVTLKQLLEWKAEFGV